MADEKFITEAKRVIAESREERQKKALENSKKRSVDDLRAKDEKHLRSSWSHDKNIAKAEKKGDRASADKHFHRANRHDQAANTAHRLATTRKDS
jgi:hypothetical protein